LVANTLEDWLPLGLELAGELPFLLSPPQAASNALSNTADSKWIFMIFSQLLLLSFWPQISAPNTNARELAPASGINRLKMNTLPITDLYRSGVRLRQIPATAQGC
jgi:hypothetical protein